MVDVANVGTVTDTATAEGQDVNASVEQTEETGAATQTDSAENQGQSDASSQEAEETVTEGNKDRGKHQTTLEERAVQLAEKRFAEMQARFEQELHAKQINEKLPFIPVDMQKVNAHLADMFAHIEDAKLQGDLVTALDLEDQVRELRASLKENESKRKEWESQRTRQQQEQEFQQARFKRIDESAEFYRTQRNIPQEAWDAAGRWISEQFQKDPILGKHFAELIDRQGEMAAFKWAEEYCNANMGAGAKADKAAKDAAKQSLPSTTGTSASSKAITDWNSLMALPSSEINKFQKENPDVFQKLKDAHFK